MTGLHGVKQYTVVGKQVNIKTCPHLLNPTDKLGKLTLACTQINLKAAWQWDESHSLHEKGCTTRKFCSKPIKTFVKKNKTKSLSRSHYLRLLMFFESRMNSCLPHWHLCWKEVWLGQWMKWNEQVGKCRVKFYWLDRFVSILTGTSSQP